jgi:hypothetical protein
MADDWNEFLKYAIGENSPVFVDFLLKKGRICLKNFVSKKLSDLYSYGTVII